VPQQDDAPAALHPAGELRGAVFLAGVAGRASGFLSGAKIIEVSVFFFAGRPVLGGTRPPAAVRDYLNGGAWELVAEHVEVESGKRADRPELAKALEACKRHKARLVIAKLDRLSRNLAFVATLMDAGVEFTAVDNPHANKLTVHILAAVAQHEREMISERTTAALQAAKARGVRLGNPNLSEAAAIGRARLQEAARQFATNALPTIRELQAAGLKSHNAIAGKLNERKVPTRRGSKWTHIQVGNVLRLAAERSPPDMVR
jgi:DNA invertase Pin-like site-specific DNA recombinase